MNEWMTEELDQQVRLLARRVHRQYRGALPVEDLIQEGLIWLYSHPGRVKNFLSDDENERRGWARLTRAVEGAMTKAARAEKAFSEGYHPDDEVFYGLTQIEMCLPALWSTEYRMDGPERDPQERPAAGDPAEGGSWMAMVLDVERAYFAAELDWREQSMLRARFDGQQSFATIGRSWEMTGQGAERIIKAALRKIQRELGGSKPGCARGCEECAGPGSRRALSNAAARAITDGAWDE